MMVLSRIALDRANRDVIRALAVPQVMHAIVEGCFAAKNDGERRLWRLDELGGQLYLLLQSETPPHSVPFPGACWQTHEYGTFLSALRDGQMWRFRLCANPVHSVPVQGGARGKVLAHVTVAQQKEWLLKKSESCGFVIPTAGGAPAFEVVSHEVKKFLRRGQPITLGVAVFEGILEVRDAQLFTKTMESGIGRAKSYGCGLMTLMRV